MVKGAWPMPLPPAPFSLGVECVGTIVALPTDASVLSDDEYRARGFAVGTRVVSVSPPPPPMPHSHHVVSVS